MQRTTAKLEETALSAQVPSCSHMVAVGARAAPSGCRILATQDGRRDVLALTVSNWGQAGGTDREPGLRGGGRRLGTGAQLGGQIPASFLPSFQGSAVCPPHTRGPGAEPRVCREARHSHSLRARGWQGPSAPPGRSCGAPAQPSPRDPSPRSPSSCALCHWDPWVPERELWRPRSPSPGG